jgi:outer membrane protein W
MSSRILIPLAAAAVLVAPVAAQAEQGDWLFRAGVSALYPDGENLNTGNAFVVVDSDLKPSANVSYFIRDQVSTELMLAWPFTHGVDVKPFAGGEERVAHVDLMPAVLSLNWHFNSKGKFRPYIGVGANYAMFSSEETRGSFAGSKLGVDDSVGAAAQLGVDISTSEKWFVNLNARWLQMEPDATLDGAKLGSLDLNPWMYSIMAGYKWGAAPPPAPPPAAAPVAAAPPPPPPPPPPPADSDGDGVPDTADKCPGTAAGVKVDSVGCPLEQTLKLLFDFDSAELRPESITELERVVKFMGDVPFATALIEGHTDSVGSDDYNLKLSDRRAKAVFDYLASRGVDPARVKSVGKGETAPIADNSTAEGRQENRRVMLIRTDTGR